MSPWQVGSRVACRDGGGLLGPAILCVGVIVGLAVALAPDGHAALPAPRTVAVALASAPEVAPPAPVARPAPEPEAEPESEPEPDDGNVLLDALRAEPALLEPTLDDLRRAGAARAEEVAAALGRLQDPRVLEAALALASSDAEPWRRALALDVLDGLDGLEGPGATRTAHVALVALTDRDPLVRRAALHALPPRERVDARRAPTILAALAAALRGDADEEVRRRAAVALGQWSRDARELSPVLVALAGDRAAAVRAGAAFACEVARHDGPPVRSALLRAMAASGEDALVRENAARALLRLGPLAEAERLAVARAARELGLD